MKSRACVVAVSGVKNSGKTSLIVKLLPALIRRGLSVATVKHDGHRFQADRPGTDSFRHLEAGALGAAVFDGEKFQLVRRAVVDENFLLSQFPEADLILLEGFKDSPWPKLEIVRAAVSARPVTHPSTRLALVTDCALDASGCPVFGLDDTEALADLLLRFVRLGRGFSAILLAGGFSSRMGRSKAELPFGGRRMIDWQLRKLSMLGIEDILLSGYEGEVEGGRFVPDIVPRRGPLSGIHAGLCAAEHDACVVLGVDTPLVPFYALLKLMEHHSSGITVLEHGGRLEPLIGVYGRALAPLCGELLAGGRSSVKGLFDIAGATALSCDAEPLLLSGCNTPEEYEALLSRASVPYRASRHGIRMKSNLPLPASGRGVTK